MLALKTQVRALLLADADLMARINLVPDSTDPAVYIKHVAEIERVKYPAISLFIKGGTHGELLFARDIDLQVDVWTEDRVPLVDLTGQDPDEVVPEGSLPSYMPPRPLMVSGLTGAWDLYERIRANLHMAHQRLTLTTPDVAVGWCAEVPGSVVELPEVPQRLQHLSALYRVSLIPTNEELVYPNA
jgi:hypothetical protein